MDTVGYSKWDGRCKEASGGMSKVTDSLASLGPSPASDLGVDGEGRATAKRGHK